MVIVRVFNNNVVLAQDGAGREVILTGRGLGFQARPGHPVDPSKIVRTFRPADGGADQLARLLVDIPPEHVQLVSDALAEVGLTKLADNPVLLLALADHVSFALRRVADGMQVEYPLLAEVQHLYAEEYAQSQALLGALNARAGRDGGAALPGHEAVGLALHLVNAGFATGDLSLTYQMTGLIQQVIGVVEQSFDIVLEESSVGVGRFVTHLRYLFVRIHQHRQLDDQAYSGLGTTIRQTYAGSLDCARRLGRLIEVRLGAALTEDEISYLVLHVARLTTEAAKTPG